MSNAAPTPTPNASAVPSLPLRDSLDVGDEDCAPLEIAGPIVPNIQSPDLETYFLIKSLEQTGSDAVLAEAIRLSTVERLKDLLEPSSDGSQLTNADKRVLLRLISLLEDSSLPHLHRFISGTVVPSLSLDTRAEVIRKVIEIGRTYHEGIRGFAANGGTPATSQYGEITNQGSSLHSPAPTSTPTPTPAPAPSAPTTTESRLVSSAAPGPTSTVNKSRGKRAGTGTVGTPAPKRPRGVKEVSAVRDDFKCVLTWDSSCAEAAHVIPHSLGVAEGQDYSERTTFCRQFWAFINMFLGPGAADKILKRFPNIDSLENIITLQPTPHKQFDSGTLSFKPLLTAEQERSYDPHTTHEASFKTSCKNDFINLTRQP